jgi:hypothetical protein
MDFNSWQGVVGGVLIVAAKGLWDYLQKRSDNAATVKVNQDTQYKQSREELQAINDKLFEKLTQAEQTLESTVKLLQETRHDLDRCILAFTIAIPMIEDIIAKNPSHKKAFDEVRKVFKADIN